MASKKIFGITITLPDENKEDLENRELYSFLTNPKFRELIETVKKDVKAHKSLSVVILDEKIVLASNSSALKKDLEFEPGEYNHRAFLADSLRSVMIQGAISSARTKYDGLKIYSLLPDDILKDILLDFTGLPIIKRDETTGIFTEDTYKCPMLYKLLRHTGIIPNNLYLITPASNEDEIIVKKNLVNEQDLTARITTEKGELMDVYEKWAAIAEREGTMAVLLPGYACIYQGCAGTRHDLIGLMSVVDRRSLARLTKEYK